MISRLLLLTVAVLAIAAPAFAHVEVSPEEAAHGATTTLTFTVPNEQDTASTVKIEIFFPEFTTVTPAHVEGWTESKTSSSATWSGGTITGENEVDFGLTVGPLPSQGDSVTFKVLQTYSNGDVVRWIDLQTGVDEPPHPAPVLKLTGAAVSATTTTAEPRGDDEEDDDSPAAAILIGALVVGGIGAGIAIVMRRRRSSM